jgi:hypothetical protein
LTVSLPILGGKRISPLTRLDQACRNGTEFYRIGPEFVRLLTGMKLAEAFPQNIGHAMELVGGYFAKSAADQFLFDGAQVERATDHFVFGQEAFLKNLEFESARRLEAGLALTVPSD